MNILLFLKNLQGRGVSKVYLNLAKGLKLYGHNPIIVIREDIIDFETDNEIYIIQENSSQKVDRLVQEKNIDFIISNNVKFLQNLHNISQDKIFYTVHMLWGERVFKQLRIKKWLELKKEYKNKNMIVDSNAVKNDLLKKIGIKPKRIEVIPDIFDYDEIITKANAFIPQEKNYLIHIGAFSKEKNHKLLLKSYAKLNTPYDLVLLGSGKLEEEMKKLAKKLHIENKVHFLGFVKNPYPYLKHAKMLITTSDNEGLPGVVIESMLLGTAVVSTNSKGVRDILQDKFKKFICTKKTLTQTIQKALESYPKIDTQAFKKRYSFEIIKRYERLFNEYK
jgi:glycosyltransferase involved in cell wall biosynthesis